jgi:hypothetical protein
MLPVTGCQFSAEVTKRKCWLKKLNARVCQCMCCIRYNIFVMVVLPAWLAAMLMACYGTHANGSKSPCH